MCLGNYLSRLHFWRKDLLDISFVVGRFCFVLFLSALWIYHLAPFCTQSFSWQILWYVSCLLSDKSLFSSCFQHSLCLLCLTMWLYGISVFFSVLLLNRILWPSWICISFSLPRFGKFGAIITIKIFLSFLSLSPPSRSPTICILILLRKSNKPLRLSPVLCFSFFFSLPRWFQMTCLPNYWLFHLLDQLCWKSSTKISSSIIVFFSSRISVGSFFMISIFVSILILFLNHFLDSVYMYSLIIHWASLGWLFGIVFQPTCRYRVFMTGYWRFIFFLWL